MSAHRHAQRGPRPAGRCLWTLPTLLALLLVLAVALPAGVRAAETAAHMGASAEASLDAQGLEMPTSSQASGSAAIRLLPSEPQGAAAAESRDWAGFGARGLLALLVLPVAFWVARRPRTVNRISSPGFEVISPTERRRFIPLEERFQALDFLSRIDTLGGLRLSANLNKVTLSVRKYGYLMEDKNYRNALLVNRRRVRRTLLRDGDVLDLGDLTLLYRDNRASKIVRFASITPAEGKSQIKFQRLRGPIRRGIPMLVPEQSPGRVFYVTKNKIYIGRSENNDLVIKSRNVYYRHAKLEHVGGRWKLQDLSILGNTYVNNRRVEQRFLKDGDEVAIETHRFKFGFVTRAMRERPPQPVQAVSSEEVEELPPEAGVGPELDAGEGPDDSDYAPSP